jgi:V/A-type H+-transporting ATPase subunit I
VFRSVPMVHLQVQVPSSDAHAVTRCIAREGLLHLVDFAHGRIAGDAAPPGTRELLAAFRDLAHRIRRLAERLGQPLPEPAGALQRIQVSDFVRERERLEARLAPLERSTEETWRRGAQAAERRARAQESLVQARRIRHAALDVDRLRRLRFTICQLGVARPEDLAALASLLAPAPFALVPLENEGSSRLTAVALPLSSRERLENALRVVAFETVALPEPGSGRDLSPLERELAQAEEAEEKVRAELSAAREHVLPVLEELAQRAAVGVLLLQAQTFFVTAGRFVVVSGWVPEAASEGMRKALMAATGGRALVEIEKPEDVPEVATGALRVPILHRNPVLLRPFQKLVQMYGTPSYTEIQPTAFFGLSFLLMFGLMFGDAGHGLVLFSAGYCLFRYFPAFLDYGILLMEGGVASCLFGLLYGSFFGIEGVLPVIWMEPIHDLPRFMAIAVGMGIVLVSFGLLLNVANAWRSGEVANALFGVHGLGGAFAYWVCLALLARTFLPRDWVVPIWLLVSLLGVTIFVLMLKPVIVRWVERRRPGTTRVAGDGPLWLTALEGSVELVDTLFSYFANTISFVRVAAFAAVHAGVFVAIFALADTLDQLRFGGPLSVMALIAGNVVMIFLEGLTVSVQVLRLEYYEFFGKFFRGGGEPYRPLMLRPGAAKGVDT